MGFLNRFLGRPDREGFARLVAKSIRRAGERNKLRYDARGFRLVAEGEAQWTINLANLYQEYVSAARSHRPLVLRHFVQAWISARKDIPDEFADLGPDLLPMVRARSYFEFFRLQTQRDGTAPPQPAYEVVADHLGVGVAYDLPKAIAQIQKHHLEKWGVSLEVALEAARANLREISGQPWEQVAPGTWKSPWQDHHDTARLVLPDIIRTLDVRGEPVAMVPLRDLLLVTGASDRRGLEVMAGLAEEALDRPRRVTTRAIRLGTDGWVPYLPETDHPLYRRYRALLLQAVGQDYSEQKQLLDAGLGKSGDKALVASFSAYKDEQTGDVRSYCVWSEGCECLLPQTDMIFFVATTKGKSELVGRGSWQRVQEVVGASLEPLGCYPERYRVRSFPSPKQLQAVGVG